MNKKQLIEDNIKLVYHLVNRHYPTFIGDEDIIQCGMLGLCKAADKWDENKSAFTTYAGKCILNEINNEFRYRKKNSGVLSLEYPVTDSDGDTGEFGDFIVGEEDVAYVDKDAFYEQLTPRQMEILNLWLRGLSIDEIVDVLDCTKQAVWKTIRKVKTVWGLVNGDY